MEPGLPAETVFRAIVQNLLRGRLFASTVAATRVQIPPRAGAPMRANNNYFHDVPPGRLTNRIMSLASLASWPQRESTSRTSKTPRGRKRRKVALKNINLATCAALWLGPKLLRLRSRRSANEATGAIAAKKCIKHRQALDRMHFVRRVDLTDFCAQCKICGGGPHVRGRSVGRSVKILVY